MHAAVRHWMSSETFAPSGWFNARENLFETRRQLDKSQIELDRARAELRTLSLQIIENDALRTLFLLPKRESYQYVYAEVVQRRIQSTEAKIMARMTSQSEPMPRVPTGSPVIAPNLPDWVAVGRVMRVQGEMVEVILASDPRSRIGVTTTDSQTFGGALLIGGGMDRLELDYVTHPYFQKLLRPGLKLVTSRESQFPMGLTVATVGDDESAGNTARVRPGVPYGDIHFLVILTPLAPTQNDTPPAALP